MQGEVRIYSFNSVGCVFQLWQSCGFCAAFDRRACRKGGPLGPPFEHSYDWAYLQSTVLAVPLPLASQVMPTLICPRSPGLPPMETLVREPEILYLLPAMTTTRPPFSTLSTLPDLAKAALPPVTRARPTTVLASTVFPVSAYETDQRY